MVNFKPTELKIYYFPKQDVHPVNQIAWNALAEKWKFEYMWHLRSLEEEIIEEGGVLIIEEENGRMRLRKEGFSEELNNKISAIIKQIK